MTEVEDESRGDNVWVSDLVELIKAANALACMLEHLPTWSPELAEQGPELT